MAALFAPVARAQIAGSASVQNDYELYGFSLSARRPVAVAAVSYDQASGLYLNGSAIGTINLDNNLAFLGLIENAGYAQRLTSVASIDGGFAYTELFQRFGRNGESQYAEIYAGAASHGMSVHVYYSPDYFSPGVRTVYEDWEGTASGPGALRFGAHLGALQFIRSLHGRIANPYDWRFTVSRMIKAVDLQVGVSGGGPGPDYYDLRPHPRTALVVAASWGF